MFPEVYTTGLLPLGHKSPNKMVTVCPHHKDLILEETPDANVIICPHEPFSGAHVGPGMLGLFFLGRER